MRNHFIISALIITGAQLTLAQSLSVQDVIKETQSGSLQIQKAESSFKEAQWKKREAYSGFLPTLTGGISYLTDKKYALFDVALAPGSPSVTVPQIIPTTQYELSARWPLFDGFASTNHYLAGSRMEDSAENELRWTQFASTRQAILQFYRSLAADILREVADQNLKVLQDHLKDVQAYRKAGVGTRYDVLRVEVQVSEAESEILNSTDTLELAKYKLGEVLGKEVEDRKPSGKLPVLKQSLLKGLTSTFEDRKDILAMKEKVEASHYQASSQNRYWVPKVFFVAGYQKYNNRNDRFDDDQNFRDAYQVGFNLTWNIFDGMASTARSGESQQEAVQNEKSYQMAQIKAKQDLEYWKRKFLYFCNVYEARVNDVERSTEAVRLAKEGRRAGTRTNTELLDAESDLYRTRAGEVNAQIGAVEALINLELASGKKLYDFN